VSDVTHQARFLRDHRWAPGRISAYLDGELASPSQARLERHADECPECRAVLDSLRRMLGLLAALPATRPKPAALEIAAAVRARLHERPHPLSNPESEPLTQFGGSNEA
jgi:anti-sigma factor RsiW